MCDGLSTAQPGCFFTWPGSHFHEWKNKIRVIVRDKENIKLYCGKPFTIEGNLFFFHLYHASQYFSFFCFWFMCAWLQRSSSDNRCSNWQLTHLKSSVVVGGPQHLAFVSFTCKSIYISHLEYKIIGQIVPFLKIFNFAITKPLYVKLTTFKKI